MDNEKTTGVKKLTPTEQNAKDIQDLKEQIAQLVNMFSASVQAQNTEKKTTEEKKEEVKENKQAEIMENTDKYTISSNAEISFVHLIQRAEGLSTYINLPTYKINLTTAGEIFTVSRLIADEVVGSYRRWFENGTLAVYNDPISIRFAETKRIKPANNYAISKYNLDTIGNLNYTDLEELVDKLAPAHKDNVIQYFKQKVYEAMAMPEARDIRFCDLRKLEILNRASGCDSLKYEIEDLKKLK